MTQVIHEYRPVIGFMDDEHPHIRVKNETAKGAQLIILYEEQIGYRRPAFIQCSINRHAKRIDAYTYEYRWFETYQGVDQKIQVAEWVAIYTQDGATAKLTSVGQLRSAVNIKSLGKVA